MPDLPATTDPGNEQSAIGNLADLKAGQVALPRFIVKGDRGVYADLARIESADDFFGFVDRVFATGAIFRGLDYPAFVGLLYDDPKPHCGGESPAVLFAADIVAFDPVRQTLYKTIRIERGEAIYMFEPTYLESTVEEPVIGELEDGGYGVIRTEQKTISSRSHLDFDEFIARAWLQGVRYGIDFAAVREAIAQDKTERLVIAKPRPFVPGRDAELKEQTSDLHRDNAPRKLAGGKIDLNQFQNRYPQVVAGTRLISKIPRTLGIDGRDIGGASIPAPLPKDILLEGLSGAGTRVVQEKDGEVLLASVGGFLNLDPASRQFSITDKIVNREGVSARSTGDLLLTGEEYEEHGEIQEKRTVQCRSITAHADVFGTILSHGGLVCLKSNLVGASATNEDGDIVVDGLASGSVLVAAKGCITLARAENCVIIARKVLIEHATCCDVAADEADVEVAEGSALAARRLHVALAKSRRQLDCALSVLVPDLSGYALQIGALQKKRDALAQTIAAHRAKGDTLRGQKEVGNYLQLAGKLQRKEFTLSAEQQPGWHKLSAQVAPVLRALAQLNELIKVLDGQSKALAGQIEELEGARQAACAGVSCTVDRVEGETQVRTLAIKLDATPLATLPAKELKGRLRAIDGATRTLFSADQGQFAWVFAAPAA